MLNFIKIRPYKERTEIGHGEGNICAERIQASVPYSHKRR